MPYLTLQDATIHYTLEGRAGAPVLLLSNSLGTSLAMWEPQMAAFGEHFQVLRYDTRGHGASSAPPGPYSIAQLAGDMLSLLDHLAIDRAHICGLSMGGITAMWFALHYPDRLDRLVLSNTAAWIGPSSNWTARAAAVERDGVASIAAAVVGRWLTPGFAQQHPALVDSLRSMLSATPGAGYAANCIAVRDNDLRLDVNKIGAKTLVISGRKDMPTPPEDGQFLVSQIAGARYVELDAAHLSNQEVPVPFAEAVLAFLEDTR